MFTTQLNNPLREVSKATPLWVQIRQNYFGLAGGKHELMSSSDFTLGQDCVAVGLHWGSWCVYFKVCLGVRWNLTVSLDLQGQRWQAGLCQYWLVCLSSSSTVKSFKCGCSAESQHFVMFFSPTIHHLNDVFKRIIRLRKATGLTLLLWISWPSVCIVLGENRHGFC